MSFIFAIAKEKHQSSHLGENTLQDVFLHILSFGIVFILNYLWGRGIYCGPFGT